ncbi:hypothetical protein BD779DRAFT_1003156 [Infundibulicybe gibba]|nr:hypothetical protein BD779DRAFT_1003156 [Infundibulicybe gibba]
MLLADQHGWRHITFSLSLPWVHSIWLWYPSRAPAITWYATAVPSPPHDACLALLADAAVGIFLYQQHPTQTPNPAGSPFPRLYVPPRPMHVFPAYNYPI